MDYPSGNTKLMDDIMFDEVDDVSHFTSASGTASVHFEK